MAATACRSLINTLQFQNKNPNQNSSITVNLRIRCRRNPHRPCNSSGENSRPLTSARLTNLGSRPRVAYQGVRFAYSESATEKAYPNCEAVPCEQFDIDFEVQVGTTKRWLIRTDRPTIGAIRKAQVVDYYVQVLMRVLGNERDAQMCMYHVSWQSNYGFCCELDDECAQKLAGMPGILSIQPDDNFGSDDKDYGGESRAIKDSAASTLTGNIKTKKLFVTGLSFYTSEKTLSAAFEGFGELVEVKVIMDKISKRSKGYAFVEYTTEEAASAALREMNGKIINGWMITVDVAKKNPPKYGTRLPRPIS